MKAPEPSSTPAWFCLRAKPKHEHIAAAHLQQDEAVEVFLPRVKFRRATARGPKWFTEALFPGYLFARFELRLYLRRVQHARGVSGIVHFGEGWPSVPDAVIAELKSAIGDEAVRVIGDALLPGDEVTIASGAFHGLSAVVQTYLPARERVAVLLDFLGRQTLLQLPRESLVKAGDARKSALG